MTLRYFQFAQTTFVALLVGTGISTGLTGCAAIDSSWSRSPFGKPQVALSTDADPAEQVRLYYHSGDLKTAYSLAKQWRRRDPYSMEARRQEAQVALDLGLKRESIQAWRAAATLQPRSADIQHETGMHLVRLGDASTGLWALRSAVEQEPNNLQYRLDLASALMATGKQYAAQAALLQAHKRHADDPHIPIALARLYEEQGNDSRAAHFYTLALRSAPHDPMLLRQRGRSYYRLGEYELARADFGQCEQALIEGQHWSALLEYGQVCVRAGDTAAARRIAAAHTDATPTSEWLAYAQTVAALPQPVSPPATVPSMKPSSVAKIVAAEKLSTPAKVSQPVVQAQTTVQTPTSQPGHQRATTVSTAAAANRSTSAPPVRNDLSAAEESASELPALLPQPIVSVEALKPHLAPASLKPAAGVAANRSEELAKSTPATATKPQSASAKPDIPRSPEAVLYAPGVATDDEPKISSSPKVQTHTASGWRATSIQKKRDRQDSVSPSLPGRWVPHKGN